MKANEIIEKIEEKYPVSFAENWDNSGFLVGDREWEVKKIFLALDVTDETLNRAIAAGADMMITHHPLIFSGMKQVTAGDFIGRRILKLIENHICYYAMHTNFDVLGMADLSADLLKLTKRQVLEVTFEEENRREGIGRVGMLPEEAQRKTSKCELRLKTVLQQVNSTLQSVRKQQTSMRSMTRFTRWQEMRLATEEHLKDSLRDTSAKIYLIVIFHGTVLWNRPEISH